MSKRSVKRTYNLILKSSRGFSLLELLITLAIFGILFVTITNIIIMNLTVARRIKARSYAREEMAFMLNVLKKDVRNSETVSELGGNSVKVAIVEDDHLTHCYKWFIDGSNKTVERTEIDCTTNADIDTSYKTPDDVEFDSFEYKIIENESNWVVHIITKAWTVGMPYKPDKQWITKEVAVSTRNFDFD